MRKKTQMWLNAIAITILTVSLAACGGTSAAERGTGASAEESMPAVSGETTMDSPSSASPSVASTPGICSAGGSPSPAADVPIDEEHFPDGYLRDKVTETADKNGDGILSAEEISDTRYLSAGDRVRSARGVEYLTQLEQLTIVGNVGYYLEDIDVSCNTKLTMLSLTDNQLTTLDLSNNPMLETVYASGNQLQSIDVSNNAQLEEIYLYDNQLAGIDVSNNTRLSDLDVRDNQLQEINISHNTLLRYLSVEGNPLTTVDLSNCLHEVQLWADPGVTVIGEDKLDEGGIRHHDADGAEATD